MTQTNHRRGASTFLGHRRIGGQLVDTLNHELRTPLATVVGHTELLQELGLPESAQRSLAAIARAGERLAVVADFISRLADLDRSVPAGVEAHTRRAPGSN